MAIDKSTRQHYDMQGGMKNYLGKQEMVSAPKYWQSRPDKPKTELAYITEARKRFNYEIRPSRVFESKRKRFVCS